MKKNSDVKVMLKEALILFVITLVSGFLLGFVNDLTMKPRQVQQEKAIAEACRKVFSEAADFTEASYIPGSALARELDDMGVEIGTVYEAQNSMGELLGYVVQSTTTEGYAGDIVLYVGITLDGKLNDVSILEIGETPGLGMQAEKVLVPQFHEKQVEQFTYTKTGSNYDSEIDAISGATITTRAVTNAVNGALKVVQDFTAGGDLDE